MGANDIVLRPRQSVPNNIMLGAPTSTVVSPSYVARTTKDALAAGAASIKWVLAIEGYRYLLTDCDNPTAAVTAHAGRDWQLALGGLFVNLQQEQKIDPWNPFAAGNGKLTATIKPDDTDQFGIDLARRAYGPEGKLTYPMDRGGSYVQRKVGTAGDGTVQPFIYVDNTDGFAPNSDVHVGTECIGISAVADGQLAIVRRGKYSPFASGGLDTLHFAEHHRVTADPNSVMLNPVCSQYPRTWKGRLVGLWMHVCDENGVLNSRADAQLVFAGRIAATYDDPNTGFAVLECTPIRETLADTMIGRDMYAGQIMDGIYLAAGRTFRFQDKNTTTGIKTANDLVVVASGASGANQINAGQYSLTEICSILNSWLASELVAGRLLGTYSWQSPVTSGQAGLRTRCYWTIPGSSNTPVWWSMTFPGEIFAMLGMGDATSDPTTAGDTVPFGAGNFANSSFIAEGKGDPWSAVFIRRGGGPTSNLQINIVNQRGTLVDQYALLPACDKPTSSGGTSWGYFLINDQCLMLASFVQSPTLVTLSNCTPAAYSSANGNLGTLGGITTYGRKASDQTQGPVTIKQIFILAGSEALITRTLFYGTGTLGYNQRSAIGPTVTTVDSIGYGLGLGIPGELLGAVFDRSVNNLPGATAECVCIIDEPTKFGELVAVDYVTRWCFPIWRDEHIVFGRWQTPVSDLAVAALVEDNKAEPVGQEVEHRPSTTETDAYELNQVKIDYNRDIAVGTGGKGSSGSYNSSITFEDSTAVDDNGGVAKAKTFEARNNYHDFMQTGQGVAALMPRFFDMWSLFSRPIKITTRSINMALWEGYAPGDIFTFDDKFMRDPATGERVTVNRTAVVIRHAYNPGGAVAGTSIPYQVTDATAEVDVVFIDLHRWGRYAPSALLDVTQFTGGYDSATRRIAVTSHNYSETGESLDISWFTAGQRVLVQQLDPDDPTTSLSWPANILDVSGQVLALDAPLTGFDANKLYQVTYDSYLNCTPLQQATIVYQGSPTTGAIANSAPLNQYASTPEPDDTSPNVVTPAELLPGTAWGDGRPLDVAAEASLVRTLNAFHDYKSAHQSPMLFAGEITETLVVGRSLIYCAPIYLGADLLSNSVFRTVTCGPLFRNYFDTASVTIWVTLTKSRPIWVTSPTLQFPQVQFTDVFGTQSWSTTSNSFVFGTPASFTANIKNTNGMAWLCVEGTFHVGFKGFHTLWEGPRVSQ